MQIGGQFCMGWYKSGNFIVKKSIAFHCMPSGQCLVVCSHKITRLFARIQNSRTRAYFEHMTVRLIGLHVREIRTR